MALRSSTQPQRWWDFPSAVLIIIALLTAATRLVVTRWTDNLSITQTVAFLGILAGLALGQSRFSARIAGMFALAYGLFVIPWQLGLIIEGDLIWNERLILLSERALTVLGQIRTRGSVTDSILFLFVMNSIFWVLSAHAGYTLTRYGNAWTSALPACLAIFIIHAFDYMVPRRAWYIAIYLFFALVFIARVTYLHRQKGWQTTRTALPPQLGLDFIRFTLAISAIIIVLAWSIPALASAVPIVVNATAPLRQSWNEFRDRIDNAFASLKSSVGIVSDYYGTSINLGRGNPLSDDQILLVKTPTDTPLGLRYYWRARTYDSYRNGQWMSTENVTRPFDPLGENLEIPADGSRWVNSFEIIAVAQVNTLFVPPQPFWVSVPARVELFDNPDDTVDISAFRASPGLSPGEAYRVHSSVSNPTVSELRNAGEDYPAWITDRYLQLPENISNRIKILAEEITAGLATPYEKTLAITDYLRQNILYTETIPSIPSNQEPIDWFLFDYKQGFCNYYATAEVILLRSLGIPSRWSIGYAQGIRQNDQSFLVRQKDAHSWPEVYFPGYGWIEFEPTTAQPALFRLPGESDNQESINRQQEEEELAEIRRRQLRDDMNALKDERFDQLPEQPESRSFLKILIPLGIISLFMIGLGLVAWRFRHLISGFHFPIILESSLIRLGIRPPKIVQFWARQASLPPLTRAYHEINLALRKNGQPATIEDTPSQRANKLGMLIPFAAEPARRLVHEYQIGIFSPFPADEQIAQRSGTEIRRLSRLFRIQKWLKRLQKPLPSVRNQR